MKTTLNKFLLFNLRFDEREQEIKDKVVFLNNVFFFAGVVALFMGFFRWQESWIVGMVDFVFAAGDFLLLYYLRTHKHRIELISSLAIGMSFVLFFALYLLAPYNTTRISLFFLLSASAFFLKGRRKGFIWLLVILASIAIGHFLPQVNTAYSHFDTLTATLYLIALFFIFDNYELLKEEQRAKLQRLNDELEKLVTERTRELAAANLALHEEKNFLQKLSATDRLTGLYNRHKFEELFEFEKSQALRYGTPLSVILLDIDFFKEVNDTQGHNMGDVILKEMAFVLRASIRGSDVVARWGGEEFVIFTPKTTLAQARELAESIRQSVSASTFSEVTRLTVSLGAASFMADDSLEKLIQRADRALYRAKTSGRNNVQTEPAAPPANQTYGSNS